MEYISFWAVTDSFITEYNLLPSLILQYTVAGAAGDHGINVASLVLVVSK